MSQTRSQTADTTGSSMFSQKTTLVELQFLVYKVGNLRELIYKYFSKLLPELIHTVSMLLIIVVLQKMVDDSQMNVYLKLIIYLRVFLEFIPNLVMKGSCRCIEEYLDRSQMKAVRVFTTYTLLVVPVLIIVSSIAFVFLMEKFTEQHFANVLGNKIVKLFGFTAVVGQSMYYCLLQLCQVDQDPIIHSLCIIAQLVFILLGTFLYNFLIDTLGMTNQLNHLTNLVIIYIVSYVVPNVILISCCNSRIVNSLKLAKPCLFQTKYLKIFRYQVFLKIFSKVWYFFLEDYAYHILVVVCLSYANKVEQDNQQQGILFTQQLVLYYFYGLTADSLSFSSHYYIRLITRVNIDSRVARVIQSLLIGVVAAGVVFTCVFYLCITPFNRVIFNNDQQIVSDLKIVEWACLKALFAPVLKATNAYGVVKCSKFLVIYTNVLYLIAFFLSVLVVVVLPQTNFVYALVCFSILENVGGLFSVFIFLQHVKNRATCKKINFAVEMGVDEAKDKFNHDGGLSESGFQLDFGNKSCKKNASDPINDCENDCEESEPCVTQIVFKSQQQQQSTQVQCQPIQDDTTGSINLPRSLEVTGDLNDSSAFLNPKSSITNPDNANVNALQDVDSHQDSYLNGEIVERNQDSIF